TGYSGTVGTLGISHITRRAVGDDVAGHRNGGIFIDAVGIVAGHRSIVDDPDHQILAVSIRRMMGIAVPDGDVDALINVFATNARRTLQRVFIADADGAIGVQGVAVEYQLAVLGIHGLVVAAQLFDLFFAQVQGAAFTIDIGVGQHQPLTAVQAVRCVDREAGFDLEVGLVWALVRAAGQSALQYHMVVGIAPRRIIRVGRVIDRRVAGVIRIVRIGYVFQLHRIIHRRNGDAQPSLVLTTLPIADGVVDIGHTAVPVRHGGEGVVPVFVQGDLTNDIAIGILNGDRSTIGRVYGRVVADGEAGDRQVIAVRIAIAAIDPR